MNQSSFPKLSFLLAAVFFSACRREPFRSSDWMRSLPPGEMKQKLVMSCTPCHQLGNPSARRDTEGGWLAIMEKMKSIDHQYGTELLLDNFDIPATARWLAQNAQVTSTGRTVSLGRAAAREYPFGPVTGFYHDMEFADGKAWAVDFFGNILYSVDPHDGVVQSYPVPLAAMAGGHTVNRDKTGGLWITFLNTNQVGRFDPQTKKFRIYSGFEKNSHVHSFGIDTDGRVYEDPQGRIWITHFTREYLSRLDPQTGAIERFNLPHSAGLRVQQVHPYGLVADSHGILWYTKLHANTLGRLDPATRRIEEISMPIPLSGPRRLAIDNTDTLWIPEYTTGQVAVFDTQSRKFTTQIPLPTPGDYPYGARKNPKTGEVWVCGTGSDSLYRYDRKRRAFVQYRLPSLVAYTRSISFDQDGAAWICYASFPHRHGPYRSGMMVRLAAAD